jgi:hypothetical protein
VGESDSNGTRHVTAEQLDDKLEVIKANQRTEHVKTRVLIAAVGAPSLIAKASAALGFISLPIPGFH